MNYAIILAAGVGQRMRNGGMPKQFVELMGKPIIVYTLEKFEQNEEIDKIIVVCHGDYVDRMQSLIKLYRIDKVETTIVGGADRQNSLQRGLKEVMALGGKEDDLVMIHDGVRPLVSHAVICENIRVASLHDSAVTVHPVTETVITTQEMSAEMQDFKKRADTYSMTSPQTFKLGKIVEAYRRYDESPQEELPLLDAAMVYAKNGEKVHLVKEQGTNIKITTPEDFYYLKAILELQENKYIFGL